MARALEASLDSVLTPSISVYGQLFEQHIITEAFKIYFYSQKDYKLSHYQTATRQEDDSLENQRYDH